MDKMGRHGMLFLAAAVSDFHVPRGKLRQHKIDSSRDAQGDLAGLTLHLDQVDRWMGKRGVFLSDFSASPRPWKPHSLTKRSERVFESRRHAVSIPDTSKV